MADEFTKAALYGIKTFNKKVKEKIGMEKLLDLLNEYDPYIASDGEIRDNFWYFIYKGGSAIFPKEIGMLKIISKEYGFIKWLVENEKIDVKELEKSDRPFDVGYATEETLYERLLMLLSIQDNPIEFLVSILK